MAKKRQFKNEDAERQFWSEQDSTGIVDWSKAERISLSQLKPSTKTISIRLPAFMLEDIRRLANKRDIPYQSLIKLFLAERLKREQQDQDAA